jgi:chemotaxis protein CheD
MDNVIGIGKLITTKQENDRLITYALGSCIAVVMYESNLRIGGLLHFMLPDSKIHRSNKPLKLGMYADTGIPKLLSEMKSLGAQNKFLSTKLVGGAELSKSSFNIGKRNILAAKKLLWKYNIRVHAEDVGGSASRTVSLDNSSGSCIVKSGGKDYRL